MAGPSLFWRTLGIRTRDRDAPEMLHVPGIGDVWLRARQRDDRIFQQVWVKREYDIAAAAPRHWAALWRAYENTERPVILDAGAHVGLSVLWWKRLFPRALIVAVEPSSANMDMLRRNLAGKDGVQFIQAALGAQGGAPLRLDQAGSADSSTRTSPDGSGEEVRTIGVDDIMQLADTTELLLAKIDIEGAEERLFAEDRAWMDRTRAIAIETHDWLWPGRATSRNLWAAVGERRFDAIAAGENTLLFRC